MVCFFCPGACGPPGAIVDVPPARWAGLTCSWDTVGLLGIVLGHQVPLTRRIEVAQVAYTTLILLSNSSKIHENQWKSSKINENLWFSLIFNENLWFSLIFYDNAWSSRRRRRPPGAARASPDDQSQSLTSPQCPRIMLGPSSRPGDRLGRPQVADGSCAKKNTPKTSLKKIQNYMQQDKQH